MDAERIVGIPFERRRDEDGSFARLREAVERAETGFADSRMEGFVVVSRWAGGRVGPDEYGISFLVSGELSQAEAITMLEIAIGQLRTQRPQGAPQ